MAWRSPTRARWPSSARDGLAAWSVAGRSACSGAAQASRYMADHLLSQVEAFVHPNRGAAHCRPSVSRPIAANTAKGASGRRRRPAHKSARGRRWTATSDAAEARRAAETVLGSPGAVPTSTSMALSGRGRRHRDEMLGGARRDEGPGAFLTFPRLGARVKKRPLGCDASAPVEARFARTVAPRDSRRTQAAPSSRRAVRDTSSKAPLARRAQGTRVRPRVARDHDSRCHRRRMDYRRFPRT